MIKKLPDNADIGTRLREISDKINEVVEAINKLTKEDE